MKLFLHHADVGAFTYTPEYKELLEVLDLWQRQHEKGPRGSLKRDPLPGAAEGANRPFRKRPTAPQAAHGSRARDRQVGDMRRIDVGPRPAGRGALAAWYAEALDVQRASGLSVAEFAPR
ncbi:MAG: hypothetical protein IM674_03525, partial [Brevundimonas sp.]|nr:hypothetical protein [Brevundimonas sp.]